MTRLTLRAAALCLLAGATPATTLSPTTTKDLVHLAQRVCCVRCESVEARLDRVSGLVFTYARFKLIEELKGAGDPGVIELRVVGGEAGGIRTVVAGMPTFRPSGECVLFLGKKNRLGYPVIVQAGRGAIGLRRTKQGVRIMARAIDGFEELKGRKRVTLARFSTAVRGAVREKKRSANR